MDARAARFALRKRIDVRDDPRTEVLQPRDRFVRWQRGPSGPARILFRAIAVKPRLLLRGHATQALEKDIVVARQVREMLVRRPRARGRALHQRLPRGPRQDRLECVELHLETDSRRPRDHRAAGVAGGRRSWWVPHDGPSRAVEERDARVERAFATFLTLRAFPTSRPAATSYCR